MTAERIARALGNSGRSGEWWRCRCPVHGSRSAALALRAGDRGLIVHCHAGCVPRDILTELRRRGLIGGQSDHCSVATAAVRADTHNNDETRRIAVARRIWDATRDARGSPVARYLGGRRIGIDPPPVLRFAPHLRCVDGSYGPAMVALVEHVERGIVGVHRTWLALDENGVWRRRDRASLGPIGGGTVRLATAGETLMVGEGLETCLAAMHATGQTAWAALSTSGLVALILPQIVRRVIILADHDANDAGERAARTAAQRWLAEGRAVRIAMPPVLGTDFNDVLQAAEEVRLDAA
jgi:putative DNA primase/helicase